jgi:hypothetical protein
MGVRFPPCPPAAHDMTRAHIAQLAEHFLGKEEVIGSSPIVGSIPTSVMSSGGAAPEMME